VRTAREGAGHSPAIAPDHPTRRIEREELGRLCRVAGPGALLAGVDEVGRGSLAGPVSVGIAVIDATTPDLFPAGLRDSKQLTAHTREQLVDACRAWPRAVTVGHADPAYIDAHGIIAALRKAASGALQQLEAKGLRPDGVLLDGTHNWWDAAGLFDRDLLPDLPVRTVVKGDAACAVIAAASVVAKVERDAMMVRYARLHPGYDWEHNKGYSSKRHIEALAALGPTPLHRTSWHLPGLNPGREPKERRR
jgi:ribonuclease HII